MDFEIFDYKECPMKIVLLGATGFVGTALLNEALDRGHAVTAIVRDPGKLATRDRLTAIAGDVYNSSSLVPLIKEHDALISAFNPGWKDPKLYDDQVRGTSSIIQAIKKAGLKRVLWVGGAGGLEVRPGIRVVDDPNFPPAVRPGSLATINALEQLKKEPELDWSYLAPSASMKSGQRTGRFRLGGSQLLVDANGQSHISVQDFAVAMIGELERPAHIHQRFTVGY
jgi:putative NADH-flavin reductase